LSSRQIILILSASLPVNRLVVNEGFPRTRSGLSGKLTLDIRPSAEVQNAWNVTFINFPCLRYIISSA
jgi:hypothetical protein